MATYPELKLITPTPRGKSQIQEIDLTRLLTPTEFDEIKRELGTTIGRPFAVRRFGEYSGRAVYLNQQLFDWTMGLDSGGELVLVPLRRK